ncbi:hypothetical protein P8452_44342 [Trifolium repens]|nr:hypothetical protein P8452_44342 [Trifolium repens]
MTSTTGNYTIVCQNPHNYERHDIWHFDNPLNNPNCLFFLQCSLIAIVSQCIDLCLKPLGQSSIVSQILGGVLFGPSFLGHKKIMLSNSLFPPKGAMVIETSAAFGVMFFFFIIGVKMDPATLMKTEKKAIIIGLSVFIFTFSIPTGLSLFMTTHVSMDKSLSNSLPLIAGSQSFTAFVVIAILLTELKILNTDIGRLAMSAAMFNDIVGFTFTAVQFAVMQNKGGLAIPEGPPIGTSLIAKMETFSFGFFYPTYLAITGLQTNLFKIDYKSMWIVSTIVIVSIVVKIGAVMLPGYYNNIPLKECFVIGLILNARGIAELVVYNLWRGTKILSDQEFSLAVFSIIVINAIITPLIKFIYDPSKQYNAITRSSIQHSKGDMMDFRVMVCIHKDENIPTMMNLLEASHASEDRHVKVITLILVELLGRSRPLLVAHQQHDILRSTVSKSIQINNAFQQYAQQNKGYASVELFTSISNFETMHDDICRIAVDRIPNILILPFHKQWAIDGSVEITNKAIQYLNIKVLKMAPCSVGILIDRGTINTTQLFSRQTSTSTLAYHVGVFFIGGADDIEALAYSSRMCKHKNVDVTVVRFLQFGLENSIERKRESNMIDEYRNINKGNNRFKTTDEVLKDGIEISKSIRKWIDSFDLVMVGMQHSESTMFEGYEEWSECPELGVIGDMLASQDFLTKASILVVQQQRIMQRKFAKNKVERDHVLYSAPIEMQIRIDEKARSK